MGKADRDGRVRIAGARIASEDDEESQLKPGSASPAHRPAGRSRAPGRRGKYAMTTAQHDLRTERLNPRAHRGRKISLIASCATTYVDTSGFQQAPSTVQRIAAEDHEYGVKPAEIGQPLDRSSPVGAGAHGRIVTRRRPSASRKRGRYGQSCQRLSSERERSPLVSSFSAARTQCSHPARVSSSTTSKASASMQETVAPSHRKR